MKNQTEFRLVFIVKIKLSRLSKFKKKIVKISMDLIQFLRMLEKDVSISRKSRGGNSFYNSKLNSAAKKFVEEIPNQKLSVEYLFVPSAHRDFKLLLLLN